MTTQFVNPRSTLHALAPIGIGTPEVESLLSYLCRLAASHAVSVTELSRKVAGTIGQESSNVARYSIRLRPITPCAPTTSATLSCAVMLELG
ncbi:MULTISPECIES: TniQ family protein [Ralstonia]|jgi:hypothetical protein|uniref:TniQ family protein n=1 Tax=Ralstonia TaxID=48736 RepID=UPI002017CFCB|nr:MULTISPECIES: TniQ family protein [Ralstonia]